ncbi:peroxisomal biogenesis factor 3 [Acetobacter pasteurianus]|nr:peroxisomal biogenesis factor 3 [Acetobacter pasteurianus]
MGTATMAIFSSLAGFFNRNKRRIFITSAVTFSIYLLVNEFVIKKFRNYQNALRQELMFKQQIKQRFIQTQHDCYYTILALLPVLAHPIIEALPVELITQALRLKKGQQLQLQQHQQPPQQQPPQQQSSIGNSNTELTVDNLNALENNNSGSSNNNNMDNNSTNPESRLSFYMNKSKLELWNLLKIKTITRSLTLIYSISGLLLITRLQLNILARRSYLESAILMAGVKSTSNHEMDPHENYIIEQSYLSLSWWLLNKGWQNISSLIEAIVVKNFEKITPKTELGIADFENILASIINEINTNNRELILTNLFPINYPDLLETVLNTNPDLIHHLDIPDSNLTKLINETNSIILDDNLYLLNLLNTLVTTNLQTLTTNLSINLGNTSNSLVMSGTLPEQQHQFSQSQQKITEIPNQSYKLATFLAQLSVQNGIMVNNNEITESEAEDEEVGEQNEIENILNSLNGFQSAPAVANELGGNVYINTLNGVEQLEDFSASVYSNFE